MGLGIAAALGGLGSLASGFLTSGASKSAGKDQLLAAQIAAKTQQQDVSAGLTAQAGYFDNSFAALNPFIQGGQAALTDLQSKLPALTQQFNPTIADLEKTPGYQFTLDQGQKATTNGYAGRGLESSAAPGAYSGPEMKGAIDYASGLAQNTYQSQFQNYWTGKQNAFNMLYSPAALGAGSGAALSAAAGGAGSSALSALGQLGTGQAGSITQGGQAAAAGQLGQANAFAGGLTGIGNAASQYSTLNALLGNGGLGGGLNNSLFSGLFGGGNTFGGFNYNQPGFGPGQAEAAGAAVSTGSVFNPYTGEVA